MDRIIMIPAWVGDALAPVEKLEAHVRGLRHLAVSIFVLRDGQVLLQRRALGKYHTPGLWANTCCTHPHWGEDPLACAHRRLKEELGITGLDLIHRGQLEYRADVGNGLIEHEEVEVFIAYASDDISLTPNPHEVMETDWVSIEDLNQMIQDQPERYTPWLRIYMAQHAATIFDQNP